MTTPDTDPLMWEDATGRTRWQPAIDGHLLVVDPWSGGRTVWREHVGYWDIDVLYRWRWRARWRSKAELRRRARLFRPHTKEPV